VYRDVGEWYHIVARLDTTDGTADIYVNGAIQTLQTSVKPSSSQDTTFNNTVEHQIGERGYSSTGYLDGNLADVYLIDGQVLDADDFGGLNATTNRWEPIAYSGTYGTNGFYLDFADSSTGNFGKDVSGQGNHFTDSNFTTDHQVLDSPTNNYCTLMSIINPTDGDILTDLQDGALETRSDVTTNSMANGSIWVRTGKWVMETTLGVAAWVRVGMATSANTGIRFKGIGYEPGDGGVRVDGSQTQTLASAAVDSIIRTELDLDTGNIEWFDDGVSVGSESFTPTGELVSFGIWHANTVSTIATHNFGQRSFDGTPTSGFLPLCNSNLPEPDVVLSGEYFKTVTWEGNNSSSRDIVTGFANDLVWLKDRDQANPHGLMDTTRSAGMWLQSNGTNTEADYSSNTLTAFNSDGFTVGNSGYVNATGRDYVAWCWKEGVIPGFDIQPYTGDTSPVTRHIPHSLGVVPELIIVKDRDATKSWNVNHKDLSPGKCLLMEQTWAEGDNATGEVSGHSDHTTTTFRIEVGTTNFTGVNNTGNNYIAYLFASVPGFSKVFSYTGNGSTDGPFIPMDFQPAYVMIKRVDNTENWSIFDTARDTSNVGDTILGANTATDESGFTSGSQALVDLVSNGVKCRYNHASVNASSGDYVGIAFAERPFKYGRAR